MMWNEGRVFYFKTHCRYLPEQNEENHKTPCQNSRYTNRVSKWVPSKQGNYAVIFCQHENLSVRYFYSNWHVYNILLRIYKREKKQSGKVWTGVIWLRTGASGGLLWTK